MGVGVVRIVAVDADVGDHAFGDDRPADPREDRASGNASYSGRRAGRAGLGTQCGAIKKPDARLTGVA
jgi:hypothetical protein